MKHRIFKAGFAALAVQHFVHVGVVQAAGDLLDQPAQLLAEVGAGDVLEKLAQKRIGPGNEVGGFLQTESGFAQAGGQLMGRSAVEAGVVKHAGGKQAVGGGLGVHVGKVLGQQVGHEQAFEGGVLGVQGLVAALQQLGDQVAQQAGLAGQAGR